MGSGAMKRWPQVMSPEERPPTSRGTISAVSCWVASVQTIPRNGRTQRRASGFAEAAPQRIDFGQGNERMIAGMISASASRGRAAGLLDDRDVELALLRILVDLRVLDPREPRAFQKPLDRRLRRADARALALLAQGRLRPGQPDDMQGESARRDMGLRALIRKVALDERVGDETPEVLRRLALHSGGDFFAEQFEEKVGHVREPKSSHMLGAPGPHSGPLPQAGAGANPFSPCGRRWREAPDEGSAQGALGGGADAPTPHPWPLSQGEREKPFVTRRLQRSSARRRRRPWRAHAPEEYSSGARSPKSPRARRVG